MAVNLLQILNLISGVDIDLELVTDALDFIFQWSADGKKYIQVNQEKGWVQFNQVVNTICTIEQTQV